MQSDDIEVNDSYVEFPFSNNNYFLSRMEIKSSKTNVVLIVLIVENILLAIGCISLIIVKKVKGSEVNEKV